jgi:phosphogluconate dehydratase
VIHVSPETLLHGPIGKVRDGDTIVIDAVEGLLDVEVDAAEWEARPVAQPAHQESNEVGFGRELFGVFRAAAAPAELGATVFGPLVGEQAPTAPAAPAKPVTHTANPAAHAAN